jgi:hypothetical protein
VAVAVWRLPPREELLKDPTPQARPLWTSAVVVVSRNQAVEAGARFAADAVVRDHAGAWRWLAKHADRDWAVVIDESLEPARGSAEGFRHTLHVALAQATTVAVGLGLTSSRYVRNSVIGKAISKAEEAQSHWVTLRSVTPGTSEAVAILTDVVADFVSHLRPSASVEEALRGWAGHRGRPVGYTRPALVTPRRAAAKNTNDDSDKQTRQRTHGARSNGSVTGQPRRAVAAPMSAAAVGKRWPAGIVGKRAAVHGSASPHVRRADAMSAKRPAPPGGYPSPPPTEPRMALALGAFVLRPELPERG